MLVFINDCTITWHTVTNTNSLGLWYCFVNNCRRWQSILCWKFHIGLIFMYTHLWYFGTTTSTVVGFNQWIALHLSVMYVLSVNYWFNIIMYMAWITWFLYSSSQIKYPAYYTSLANGECLVNDCWNVLRSCFCGKSEQTKHIHPMAMLLQNF